MPNFNRFKPVLHCSLAKNSSMIGLSCEPRSSQWNQRSKRTSVLSATKYLRSANMMIAMANYHVQQHNVKINLSPSVSSCRRSLSTTRPTVSAPRLGEWGILEKIFKRPILCPLLFNLQILQKKIFVFFMCWAPYNKCPWSPV